MLRPPACHNFKALLSIQLLVAIRMAVLPIHHAWESFYPVAVYAITIKKTLYVVALLCNVKNYTFQIASAPYLTFLAVR